MWRLLNADIDICVKKPPKHQNLDKATNQTYSNTPFNDTAVIPRRITNVDKVSHTIKSSLRLKMSPISRNLFQP